MARSRCHANSCSWTAAAIGLGGVFLHLGAELNFHRLFDDTIAGADLADVAARQRESFTAAGVPLP